MPDRASDPDDCGADAAAYAIGALEAGEADAFRRHLDTCAICQDEVESLSGVARILPMAAPQYRVPRRFRRRVLREIRSSTNVVRAPRRTSRRPSLAIAGASAAVLLAAAVFVGTQLGSSGHAPTHIYAASVGDAAVKVTGERAELVVNHLLQPGAGKIYEVWLKHGAGAPKPTTALFDVDTSGRGDVLVPGSVHGVSKLLVTVEPAGGTRVPTSAPVIVAALT